MMRRFETYYRHSEAECFRCEKGELDGVVRDRGHADGRGRWAQGCKVCGMSTYYDVERDPDDPPEPCTAAANAAGCTCRMSPVNSATIDPPEPIIDRSCPLHGSERDPDDARDEMLERRAEARAHPEWNED
jgi:hypothetical protein